MAKQNCMTIIKEKPEIPDEVRNALWGAIGPWGEVIHLLQSTHLASAETMALLKKIKEFWELVEDSLLICPRESLH